MAHLVEDRPEDRPGDQEEAMRHSKRTWALMAVALFTASCLIMALAPPVASQGGDKYRVGFVTLLAGPFAASIGVPARQGAELVAEAINNGTLPAPYATKGI